MSFYGRIPLGHLLSAQIEAYQDEYRAAWRIDAETPPTGVSRESWLLANDLSQVGGLLLSSARALEVSPTLREYIRHMQPGTSDRAPASHLAAFDVTSDRMAIELASLAVSKIEEAPDRLRREMH